MIRFVCHTCGFAMDIPERMEWGKVECTSCGSRAISPAGAGEEARPSYQGEPLLYMGRPGRKGQLGLYVLGLSFLLVGIASLFLPETNRDNSPFGAFFMLGTVGWLFLIAAEISVRSTTYLLTSKAVLMETGWLPKSRIEIPVSTLKQVRMRQGILGRRWGLGRIGFTTGRHPGCDCVWWGVRSPQLVHDLVLSLMSPVASSGPPDLNP